MNFSRGLLVIFSTIVVLHFSVTLGAGDQLACIDACDAQYTTNPRLVFCSTDKKTYNASQAALQVQNYLSSGCYAQCSVNFLHLGPCGCPNDCYAEIGQGTCSDNTCKCADGWGGKDCSAISCNTSNGKSGNKCSNHGVCKSQSAALGGDICQCEPGFTAYDCSVPIPQALRNYGVLPYGEIQTGAPYYKKDNYGDAHPFFNTSVIATVKITLSDADFASLLAYETLYTQEYVPATLSFSNGVISKNTPITFRVKGSSTRLNIKKSWNIKFPKGEAYLNLKGFALKSNIGDRVVTNQLVADFYRAMRSTTYRHSLAELFINDIYYGMESIHERMDDNWMKSRWDEDKTNLYKLGPYAMQYLGSDPEAYSTYSVSIYDGAKQFAIEQAEGDGDFNDFVGLVTALNSSQSALETYAANHIDIGTVVRAMALETITQNSDGYTGTGNNFQFMNTVKLNKGGPKWNYIGIDYDVSMTILVDVFAPLFGMTGAQLKALMDAGVTNLGGIDLRAYIMNDNPYGAISYASSKPLMRLFNVPGANETFTQALKDFVNLVIIQKPGVTESLRQAYTDMARYGVKRDKMYTVATGSGLGLYEEKAAGSKKFIDSRWAYLASLVYANGNGVCNSLGQCTCNSGYFGATCNTFCGVEFIQQQTNQWVDGGKTFTQYSVTVKVGSSPLYSAVIKVNANATSFSAWNIDSVSGSSDLYTFPSWRYQNGAIPANSNSVTFGYTVSNNRPASFRLNNNACTPSNNCNLDVNALLGNSWQSNGLNYQSVQLSIKNNGPSAAANAKVLMNFYGNSFISSSYNIAPSTSAQGESSKNFTCSLWNLQQGQTSTSCGYTLASPSQLQVNHEVHLAQAICL